MKISPRPITAASVGPHGPTGHVEGQHALCTRRAEETFTFEIFAQTVSGLRRGKDHGRRSGCSSEGVPTHQFIGKFCSSSPYSPRLGFFFFFSSSTRVAMAEGRRQSGVVSWFSPQKGFGFIKPDDGGEDLFVHQTSIRAEGFRVLSEGEAVEFDVERGDDGRAKAVDVTSSGAGGRARAGGDAYGGGVGGWRSGGAGGRFGGPGGGCYSCGESGHLARDCPHGGGGGAEGGGGGACYNCGQIGHHARDCGRAGGGVGACYSCGQTGHLARDCTSGRGAGGGGGSCFHCGRPGHFARECPNVG